MTVIEDEETRRHDAEYVEAHLHEVASVVEQGDTSEHYEEL